MLKFAAHDGGSFSESAPRSHPGAAERRATNHFSGVAGLRVHEQRKQCTHAIVVDFASSMQAGRQAASHAVDWGSNITSQFLMRVARPLPCGRIMTGNPSPFVPDNWRARIFSTPVNLLAETERTKTNLFPFSGQTITYSYVCADDPRCKVHTRRNIIPDRPSLHSHGISISRYPVTPESR